ncbi:hypothetical protein BO86DRAFT_387231 [Aspergillus japonicus CBS 114.51]|uniref:Secreted protein n=1 Tax=Aspergillus japonicus CBS 114.51 TaxID=1448312 RepID=A0A8T8X973_ASPJA|nr:hypothetical protein BO86DRAFT_387231 [Aspergillus japonicus CBS 114.51]RAH84112.1 hypothetical protein BO86DRAFT_387231 [Aspergillus japonicus CBS 114.51]
MPSRQAPFLVNWMWLVAELDLLVLGNEKGEGGCTIIIKGSRWLIDDGPWCLQRRRKKETVRRLYCTSHSAEKVNGDLTNAATSQHT